VPFDLRNEAEAEVWRAVVNAVPPDWFTSANQYLLIRFCKAVVMAGRVDDLLEAELAKKRQNRQLIAKFARLQLSSTVNIARLSTKMRLAQQSVWQARPAGRGQEKVKTEASAAFETLNDAPAL
jgi:hypothetical protein